MSKVGNVFTKIPPGTATWGDAQAYSSIGYNNNMYAEANNITSRSMFGLNSDPILNASYSSLDYAWFFPTQTGPQPLQTGLRLKLCDQPA